MGNSSVDENTCSVPHIRHSPRMTIGFDTACLGKVYSHNLLARVFLAMTVIELPALSVRHDASLPAPVQETIAK